MFIIKLKKYIFHFGTGTVWKVQYNNCMTDSNYHVTTGNSQ